jgi:hypothetical protein
MTPMSAGGALGACRVRRAPSALGTCATFRELPDDADATARYPDIGSNRAGRGSVVKDNALFIGWGGTYPGREHHARKTFTEFVEALTEFEAKGKIESFETVVLTSNDGPLEGFDLIYGDLEKLALIQQEDVFQQLRIKARLDNAKLFVVPGIAGGRVAESMILWEEFATEIEKELVTA